MSWSLKSVARTLIAALCRCCLNLHWTGDREVLNRSSARIVTANHVSYVDGIAIALCATKYMHYAVETPFAVHNPYARALFAFLKWLEFGEVVPVDSSSPFAVRRLANLIQQGHTVMIFPEGAISPDSAPQPEQSGVQWLQKATGHKRLHIEIRGADRSCIFGKSGTQLWPRITLVFPSVCLADARQEMPSSKLQA